jgi:hypothetical protein
LQWHVLSTCCKTTTKPWQVTSPNLVEQREPGEDDGNYPADKDGSSDLDKMLYAAWVAEDERGSHKTSDVKC